MRHFLTVLILCLLAVSAHAAELVWDAQTITSPLTVERSATQAGPYSTVATLPTGATRYILTPGAYGWYRVSNSAGPSNVVQFSLDLYTGLVTDRLNDAEARITLLEAAVYNAPVVPPTPSSNLTVRDIDADHVEIVGTGCLSLRTTGSGLRRIVECVH